MKILTIMLLAFFIPQSTDAAVTVRFGAAITPGSMDSLTRNVDRAARRLRADDDREIVIHLSSEGGNLREAARFVDEARALEQNLNVMISTKVTGSCDSACTVLFTAGSRRYAKTSAKFGFHAPKIESRLPRGITSQMVMDSARNLWLQSIARVDASLAYRIQNGRYLFGEDMNYIRANNIGYGYITEFVRR